MATSDSIAIQLPLAIEGFTVEIPTSMGYVTVVDAIDADLAQKTWTTRRNSNSSSLIYVHHNIHRNGRQTSEFLHRTILARILSRPLSLSEVVDHIDGNGLNNRRSNLRLASHRQNLWNQRMRKDNTAGFKGITAYGTNKWRAQIRSNGKRLHLGTFDTPEEAHEAYCTAARELFGEFARFK